MSWILGIDTSSIDLGIGLYQDTEPVASYSRFLKNSHAEHIEQAVALMLRSNNVPAEAVTHIAAATGPGSFTGLRIGLAFVKGFCAGGGTTVMPVSSLSVLAYGALPGGPSAIVSAIDARRDEVFWARFSVLGNEIARETPDTLSPAQVFMDSIRPGDAVITDTMGYEKSTVFNVLDSQDRIFSVERFPVQRGLCCAKIGAAHLADTAAWKNALDVLPDYLRSFTSPPPRAGKGRTV